MAKHIVQDNSNDFTASDIHKIIDDAMEKKDRWVTIMKRRKERKERLTEEMELMLDEAKGKKENENHKQE